MTGRVLENYVRRPESDFLAPAEEGIEDCLAFGRLRGVRERALMLELRKRDGSIDAIAYAWIERIHFDPSAGITLRAGGECTHIIGRNLNAGGGAGLLDNILRQRVAWVREASRAELLTAGDSAVRIERIA